MHCSPPLQVVVARSPMAGSCAVERCLRLGKLGGAQRQAPAWHTHPHDSMPACSSIDQGLR